MKILGPLGSGPTYLSSLTSCGSPLWTLSPHQAMLSLTSLLHVCCSPARTLLYLIPALCLANSYLLFRTQLGHHFWVRYLMSVLLFPSSSLRHMYNYNTTVTFLLLPSSILPHPTANSMRAAALSAYSQMCLSCLQLPGT